MCQPSPKVLAINPECGSDNVRKKPKRATGAGRKGAGERNIKEEREEGKKGGRRAKGGKVGREKGSKP